MEKTNGRPTQKGIYIRNGRKVIMKSIRGECETLLYLFILI